MKTIFSLVFFAWVSVCLSQSDWIHVGPISENNISSNTFETGRLNNITIDPLNTSHLFASGHYASLWESTDGGASWISINTTPTGANGVSAVTFLNSTSILVGSYHPVMKLGGIQQDYSLGMWIYDFTTGTYTALGAFPNPGGIPYTIKSVDCYPGSSSIIFASTSMGLFRSTNGGLSWGSVPVVSGCIENIAFVANSTGSYWIYLAGSNTNGDRGTPTGTVMVKESIDGGITFPTDISFYVDIPTPYNVRSHTKICVGKTLSDTVHMYLYTDGTDGVSLPDDYYGWGTGMDYLHEIKKHLITGEIYGASMTPGGLGDYGTTGRMAFAYDQLNDGLWLGGVDLTYYSLKYSYAQIGVREDKHSGGTGGKIHDDMHDIKFSQISSSWYMYVACDGGLVKTAIPLFPGADASSHVFFTTLNYALNVSMVNGFSGTDDDSDLYVLGSQDIVSNDVYDAQVQKNIHSFNSGENDGGLIDKFNKNNMFFDLSSYNFFPGYRTSTDGGVSLDLAGATKSYYWPLSGASTFQQGTAYTSGEISEGGFTSRLFFQDPYRPNRVFHTKLWSSILQYDYVSKTFVDKIWMGAIEPHPGDFGISAFSYPEAMSFSPETVNSLHFVLDGDIDPTTHALSRPTVVKYIGPNIDDCWRGHNDINYTVGSATYPQWASLTGGLWESWGISTADMAGIHFYEIETSPFNKDVVYILIYVPNHPDLKVMKYDGVHWSNYSNGLPNSEFGLSMIMDRQSYDGIYLSTDKGVYYRNPSSTQWDSYTTGLPILQSRQMEINYADNTVRAGTFGRGIYSSPLQCPASGPITITGGNTVNKFVERAGLITSSETYNPSLKTEYRSTTEIDLVPGFSNFATTNSFYSAFIHPCNSSGNSFRLAKTNVIAQAGDSEDEDEEEREASDEVKVYPNPNTGQFSIYARGGVISNIKVYDMYGRVIYANDNDNPEMAKINISEHAKGMYIVRFKCNGIDKLSKVTVQ